MRTSLASLLLAITCIAAAGCEGTSSQLDAATDVDASTPRDATPDGRTPEDAQMPEDAEVLGDAGTDSGTPDSATPDAGVDAAMTFCEPAASRECYGGPAGTEGVGACRAGTETCLADGSAYGACEGEVLPLKEDCTTPADDDCNGDVNDGCVCAPDAMEACYDGPAGTMGVGACRAGTHVCDASGEGWGPCTGQTLPAAETCTTPIDDDCDGMINEEGAGCVCMPGSMASCYTGPVGTAGVGICRAGAQTCNALGTAYGPCTGEVLPATESCTGSTDDDCDGTVNDGCPVTYAGQVQPILQAHCGSCHTTGGSGGANLATSYASTQLASYYCAGSTKGACALTRIQNGSMPAGAGCTGNPVTDAGNPRCLTAAEQATIQAWITGGQLP